MAVAGEWEALRQVLVSALDLSRDQLTNFKGAFHKIPCGHSPLEMKEE
jgi:hypothetical protein